MKWVGLLGPPIGDGADVGECDTPVIDERELKAAEHTLGFVGILAMGGCQARWYVRRPGMSGPHVPTPMILGRPSPNSSENDGSTRPVIVSR